MIENKIYSFGSFKHKSFTGKQSVDFSDTIIKGSCFEQANPMTPVFPAGIKNLIFEGCNLNNCLIPPGAKLVNCCNYHWAIQNDLEQWIIDAKTGEPVEPMKKTRFKKLGLSTDPKDIPKEKMKESLTVETMKKIKFELANLQADPDEMIRILKEKGRL